MPRYKLSTLLILLAVLPPLLCATFWAAAQRLRRDLGNAIQTSIAWVTITTLPVGRSESIARGQATSARKKSQPHL